MCSRRPETERLAREQGVALQASAAGVAILPPADGKPIEQAQLLAMSEEEQKELDERRTGVSETVEEATCRWMSW